jgi:pimeloyl-ACP methyl ester carboxylesterase
VATFVLIHGGGGSAWDWHLVVPELENRGHEALAVDLPCDDAAAGWSEYVDVAAVGIGERQPLVAVGHSLGGFTAPLVCTRAEVAVLVLLAGMIPAPGELFERWWENVGYEATGYEGDDVFYHDVPHDLAEAAKLRSRQESSRALREPWPLDAWPDVRTSYLLCRDDRMFSADWARRHARERLGIDADEIDGGHYLPLSHPLELAQRLDRYAPPSW